MRHADRRKALRRDYDDLYQDAVQNGRLCANKTDVNSLFDYRPVSGKSVKLYKDILVPWEAYVRNNPADNPDPHDIQTLKHFIKFLALSMRGLQTEDNPLGLPTVDSVRAMARRFISSYNRMHRNEPPIPYSMAAYIQGPLTDELGLIRGRRSKRIKKFFTAECYMKLQAFNWNGDWHIYIHDGARVDAHNMINAHCYTSARLQEVCQARYRDLECHIGYFNGYPDIKLRFTREFCKGKAEDAVDAVNQPEHPFAERLDIGEQHYPALLAQPIVPWLANFLSVGALAGVETLDDLLQIRPPQNCSFRVLEFADHMLDKPVFPEWSANGKTDVPKSPNAWGNDSTNLARRSGFTGGLGWHSARRTALFNCNNAGYSLASTLQFASQKNVGVLVGNYLGSLSTVDGAATYLGLPARTDLHVDFHSATMRYNPGLEHALSSAEQEKIKTSEEHIRYSEKISDLNRRLANPNGVDNVDVLRSAREEAYKFRNMLFESALRAKQQNQKLDYETKSFYEEKDWHRGHFDRLKNVLSEARRRLSNSMTMSAAPRSDLWKQAIEDLIFLRKTDCNVAYQDCLQPKNGMCPIEECKISVTSLPIKDRWPHIFSCSKNMLQKQHGYAQFCFTCSSWFSESKKWEDHCNAHLHNRDIPTRYDPVTYRTAIACAGHCPVCIWRLDGILPGKRFYQFTDKEAWKKHIFSCVYSFIASQADSKKLACPDVRCPLEFISQSSLWHHLSDVHSIPTPTKGALAKLDAKRAKFSLHNHFKTQFVENCPNALRYSESGDAIWSVEESCTDSLSREETTSLFSESRHGSQTPPSECHSEFLDEVKTCLSSDEADIAISLADTVAEQDLPVDPMLLEADTAQERELSSCLDVSMPLLEELPLSETALPPPEDSMSLDEDACPQNESSPLPDDQFRVDRLLGKWRYRRKDLYYLRWESGEHSFEPGGNICEDMRNEFDRQAFTGFREGAHIIKWTKVRKGEAWYLVAFEGCSEKWELPETALHADLARPSKPVPPLKAKGKRGRPRSKRV